MHQSPGDRLPFIKYQDEKHSGLNIQEKMHGKFFCFFIFSDTAPKEIIASIEPFKNLFSIELIPFNPRTEMLYKEFGIKNNGCYLIRPDMYIAYRADKFDAEHLIKYFSLAGVSSKAMCKGRDPGAFKVQQSIYNRCFIKFLCTLSRYNLSATEICTLPSMP